MKAWLFDVDGVITNPQAKKIIRLEIVDEIIKILQKGSAVGLITGRSVDWLQERVLNKFLEQCPSCNIFENLFISGEKGGVWGALGMNGKVKAEIDRSLELPKKAQDEIRSLVRDKFSDIAFYDEPKKTMSSVELIDGLRIEKFKEIQPNLDSLIRNILKQHNLEKDFRVDSVLISSDIQNKRAGKDLGTQRFINWLRENNFTPAQFIAFGDNHSDLAMGEYLFNKGYKVTYVFVGKPDLITKDYYPFEVIYTLKLYDEGTLEYLASHR